jgi:hypothetical protein
MATLIIWVSEKTTSKEYRDPTQRKYESREVGASLSHAWS